MQDLRLAVRALRATPIVTAVEVLSLALGIGANTAIFSLVNSLLIRELPVVEPARLVAVAGGPSISYRPPLSYATFDQIRRHGSAFDGALAYSAGKSLLTIGGDTRSADRLFVSGDFFTTLGVPALFGRTLAPTDDVPGGGPGGPTAVISYNLWQERMGGSAAVIGSSVTVERVPVTIVGITPPRFFGVEVGRTFDVALPVTTEPLILPSIPFDDDVPWLNVILRLKPGLSFDAAATALRGVQPQIRAGALPKTSAAADFLKEPFTIEPMSRGTSALRQRFARPLEVIFVVVTLVLLVACANIANVMLARGARRRHELSVRLALGASRWRLARQFLVESLVVAAAGTVLGLLFAAWASRALVARAATAASPAALDLSLDFRVLTFTVVSMVLAAVLFGVAPAVRATQVAPIDALKDRNSAGGRTSGGPGRAGNGVVVAQVALSLTLVVAAGLFLQTFQRLTQVSLGFDRDRTIVATVTASTVPAAERNVFYHRLVSAAAAVPGVAHAGGSLNPPLIGFLAGDFVISTPGMLPEPGAETISQSDLITPGWLAAYGTSIRAGRDIDDHDRVSTQPVILVNEAFVRRFFPERNPVGTTLDVTARLPPNGDFPLGPKMIVGVVQNAVYRSVRGPARPTLYFPMAQREGSILNSNFYIAVRPSTGPAASLTRAVASALTAVNRDLTITIRPLAAQVDEALAQDRLVAWLSGFFGALTLLLAGLGLYGVTSNAIASRRGEIGIRLALGAKPAGVVRLVLSRVLVLVGLGVVAGGSVCVVALPLVASLLYGLDPFDPWTLAGSAIVLVAVGALAGWLPAYHASRIDPAEVLRSS